ncbi:LysR substrate-binding domain-containing protein [Nocardioides sp. LHD-245]|uniref:LysR substrate-binding domain-containing protein n=1 Tax=Nocardioides sp. LHD-245 TaxID=3051387 RepID=UPI0027E0CF2E|nr:LysR substrate-binding domain-containing protein [Nocardioides sp. LHD-245]
MADPAFTLTQLRYFAAAAEHLSMTGASKALMVSQSAVSTAVAQLEKDLGIQLLIRHHARGLTLTAAGQSFYQELRGFLAHASDLAEAARTAGDDLTGELTIGCFSTLGPFELPRLLAAYNAQHPRVDVSVVEAEHATLKNMLRQARCEVALMYGYDLDEDLDHVVVYEVPPYVLVGAEHRLARRRQVSLQELADDPMVILDLPHTAGYMSSIMETTGFAPRIRHQTTGFETVRSMVAHGHGFAILNQLPAHDLTYDGGKVVALRIRDEVPPLSMVVATMRGVRLTARAREMVRMCRRTVGRWREDSV